VGLESPAAFALNLRIPAWSANTRVLINNSQELSAEPGTYLNIDREWQPGDCVTLHLDMSVRRVRSHPSVVENSGRIALMAGPLLYCCEEADNPNVDLQQVSVKANASIESEMNSNLLGGVVTLSMDAEYRPVSPAWLSTLYETAAVPPLPRKSIRLKAIPYYAWANREPGQMRVWIREG
jgi:DUF1680 family protein